MSRDVRDVPVLDYTSPDQWQCQISASRSPSVLRGCPLGSCTLLWTPEYLSQKLAGLVRPVHVTKHTNMNFLEKNFRDANMEVSEVVRLASEAAGEEKYYLRAVSEENPRTKPVRLDQDFPSIADDFLESLYL